MRKVITISTICILANFMATASAFADSCNIGSGELGKLGIQVVNKTDKDFSVTTSAILSPNILAPNSRIHGIFSPIGPTAHASSCNIFQPKDKSAKNIDNQSVVLYFKADEEECFFFVNNITTEPDPQGNPQIYVSPKARNNATASGDGCIAKPIYNRIDRTITFTIISPVLQK